MIDLARLRITLPCPYCTLTLEPEGWHMPGMRPLARGRCPGCTRRFFVDLPVGQAIYTPVILDPETGEVHHDGGAPWFAGWLREAWRERSPGGPALRIEGRKRSRRKTVLINCIDRLYGHALLKLLNAQQYLDDGLDVIVLVQPFLAHLVPDGVSETWIVDLPLGEGTRWCESLAEEIRTNVQRSPGLRLAPAFSHPHPTTFSIERFSRIRPFDLERWREQPFRVTFIWRDDRPWRPSGWFAPTDQLGAVAGLFKALRRQLPGVRAAVTGFGVPNGLPRWIRDLRDSSPSARTERTWLECYAASHAVIGVHGSNMLLPSAHAGSTFELIGEERRGNFLQDIIFNGDDPRDLFFRYRFLPAAIAPKALAAEIAFVLGRYPDFGGLMALAATRDPDVRR